MTSDGHKNSFQFLLELVLLEDTIYDQTALDGYGINHRFIEIFEQKDRSLPWKVPVLIKTAQRIHAIRKKIDEGTVRIVHEEMPDWIVNHGIEHVFYNAQIK